MNNMQLERMVRVNTMWQESAWARIRSQIRFAEHLVAMDAKHGAAGLASLEDRKSVV